MKTIFSLVIAMMISCNLSAQDYKQLYAQQKDLKKQTEKVLKAKATKDAQKEAKRLMKEGWEPMPGKLPIAKQLDRIYNMQVELDAEGMLKYIVGGGEATANTPAAAQMNATAVAVDAIASSMSVSITSLIDQKLQNEQITATEAATLHEAAEKSKMLYSQNIGQTLNVLEIQRTLDNGNTQVRITKAYSSKAAMKVIRDTVKGQMQDRDLQNASLDEKLGW